MTTRADVVAEARTWIGTPFHHMARSKAVGVDCSGLLVGVCRALGLLPQTFDTPAYTQTPNAELILDGCQRYLTPITFEAKQPGDVLLLILHRRPQHLGILADCRHGGLSIIHATLPRVIETRLLFSRAMRFAAAYSLPGIA